MTISQIRYTSRQQAEQLRGSPFAAVVSITDPGSPEAKLDPLFRHVIRLSFFDAIPAADYLPAPIPGLFDYRMAGEISSIIEKLHTTTVDHALIVHCEYGVSRSAAVALFAAALTGAPLAAHEFTYAANQWVLDQFQEHHPYLDIPLPPPDPLQERRHALHQ